ncbi:uncharacterized protein LOC142980636 isoform X2 [Anticarsia gemmatalis]|uniref:uncharacterized protein LOC142980636 isoform X2 n=1 Tax=Anticarsia gemmatalis TaxID=129554 RepID=UPI003F76F8A8
MFFRAAFIIWLSLSSHSCSKLMQWYSQFEESHEVEGSADQLATKLATGVADFARFTDWSKQDQRNFTLSEVSQCTGQDGRCLYIVFDNRVLDLTEFLPYHSGGSSILLEYAGHDASAAMRAAGMPAQVFNQFLHKFVIGRVVPSKPTPPTSEPTIDDMPASPETPWSTGLTMAPKPSTTTTTTTTTTELPTTARPSSTTDLESAELPIFEAESSDMPSMLDFASSGEVSESASPFEGSSSLPEASPSLMLETSSTSKEPSKPSSLPPARESRSLPISAASNQLLPKAASSKLTKSNSTETKRMNACGWFAMSTGLCKNRENV